MAAESVNDQLPRRRARRWAWPAVAALYAAMWASLFQVYDGGRLGGPLEHLLPLTSALHGRDLDLADDIVAANITPAARREMLGRIGPGGWIRVDASPGATLVWSVVATPMHLGLWALAGWTNIPSPERFAFLPMLLVSLTTAVCGLLALWLMWRLARLWARPGPAAAAVAVVLACSPLPFHLLRCPASADGLSTLAVAWWLWLTLGRWGYRLRERSPWIGLAGGLMVLVDWSNMVWLIPGVASLVRRGGVSRETWPRMALGFVAMLGIQLTMWRVARPEVGWETPATLGLLFSPHRGILGVHPALVLGFAGLVFMAAQRARWGLALALTTLLHLIVTSCAPDWDGGWGIGNRHVCAALPALAVGTAHVFARVRRRSVRLGLIGVLVTLALGNWLMMLFGDRGLSGSHSPLALAGWSALSHFWGPLAGAITEAPLLTLIDNSLFAPWVALGREPRLAHFGIVAMLFPAIGLWIVHSLRRARRLAALVIALLFLLQAFAMVGMRGLPPGAAEIGAEAARIAGGDEVEIRAVRRAAEAALDDHLDSPAVFLRLIGLSARARRAAHESWDDAVTTRSLARLVQRGAVSDKWALTSIISMRMISFTPRLSPMTLSLSDQGVIESLWAHGWDPVLMEALHQRLCELGDTEALQSMDAHSALRPAQRWLFEWREAMSQIGDVDDAHFHSDRMMIRRHLEVALAPLERLRLLNPLDLETLNLLIRTRREMARVDAAALQRAEALEQLARRVTAFELDRIEAAEESRLFIRDDLEDQRRFVLGIGYH